MAKIECQGKTSAGDACRAPAGPGGLCFFHANPDSAKSLGQIGGRKNRRSVVDLQVADNLTAADLRRVTGQAIRLLLGGELGAREGSALAQLCNSLHRVLQTADLEARVALLEEQVAARTAGTNGSPISETGASAEGDVSAQIERTSCLTKAHAPGWTDSGHGAESPCHDPDEAGKA